MSTNLTLAEITALIKTADDAIADALAATYALGDTGGVNRDALRALNIAAAQLHVARVNAPRG